MVRDLPRTAWSKRYVIMSVDYFTKWVEAKSLIRQDKDQVYQILKEIFTRAGVTRVLVTDNVIQFTAWKIEDFCTELDIHHIKASQSYPQANGQVEVMNRVIFTSLMKRLQQEGGSWDQELPTVVWSFRTSPNPIIGETPFSLVYGSDALLPVEIYADMAWVTYYDELANGKGLLLNLNLLKEKRVFAIGRLAKYKQKVAAYYNKKVWSRQFVEGDLVLRARQATAHGKPGKLESL
ncbi:hypothetical protein LIER_17548 [Lithospermum erythrorhizon]|uniref:Integrase catalytic domain-containing protein n=1 Tax=Lithospermum erythrorhizon TaxID=34254 RepID=A0AAV3QG70_LITER